MKWRLKLEIYSTKSYQLIQNVAIFLWHEMEKKGEMCFLFKDTLQDGRPARPPCTAKTCSHLRPHTAVAPPKGAVLCCSDCT